MQPESPTIEIRRAFRDDASQIGSVLYESFLEFRSCYTPEAFAATVLYTETIQDRFGEGPTWVALQNNSVVGTVSAIPKKGALYIRSMAVSPETRGRGIGKLLLMQVEDFAREKGFRILTLSTTPFLSKAIRLYESFGFTRSNEGPHKLKGTPLFSMVKELK
jgi:ribosomal protein S18 acetylase RimI-like enzyme